MIEHHADYEPLLALATPELYRRNLFRVLGLSVNATSKDVQRQQNRLRMQRTLGIAASDDQGYPLSLKPPPFEEDIRAAMDRLNQPVNRLIDEVLWFWPTNGRSDADPALKALETGQHKKARELWIMQADEGQAQAAIHNLAVFDHLVALDYELRLASQQLGKKQRDQLIDLWHRSLSRWKQVLDGEDFWSLVKDRTRELNDIQLTSGFARRIRSTLPMTLLLINIRIALSAAKRGDDEHAKRHMQLVYLSDFGNELVDAAVREALNPIRNRIKTAIDSAKSQWAITPQKGNQYAQELFEQIKSPLTVVDTLLPAENPNRIALHDMAAEAVKEGGTKYSIKTNDWKEGISILEIARRIAVGETLHAQIDEYIENSRKNIDAGNDWCTSGYWDLPAEIVNQLETAREKMMSGDYDAAIRVLILVDPKIGKPLRRCVSFCLCQEGVRIGNDALNAYSGDSSILKKIVENITRFQESPASAPQRWGVFPNPNMHIYMVPPCLYCLRTGYATWRNFTYKDVGLFMCNECWDKHSKEIDRQKMALIRSLKGSLEYLLLADEVDPGDLGVRKNLETAKETAKNIDCSIPKTDQLKKEFGEGLQRKVHYSFEPREEDHVCHFCSENPADESSGITVPMCGDRQKFDTLFGIGIEYRYADIIVPRCRRCRIEHREFPECVEKWQESKLVVVRDENFPDEVKAVDSAWKALKQAEERVKEQRRKIDDAHNELKDAEALVGDRCSQCNSKEFWNNYICSKCDKAGQFFLIKKTLPLSIKHFVLFPSFFPGFSFIILNVFLFILMVSFLPDIPSAIITSLFISSTISFLLLLKRVCRLGRLRRLRKKEIAEKRSSSIANVQAKIEQLISGLKSIEETVQILMREHADAKKKLELAWERVVSKFKKINPEPKLMSGVKSESSFETFIRIKNLRRRGWGFGHELLEGGKSLRNSSVDVRGLVGHEPHPIEVHRPDSSSERSKTGRDRIKEIAQNTADDEITVCPVCNTRMKSKNLLRHYDKEHGTMPKQQIGSKPSRTHKLIKPVPPSDDIQNRILCIDDGCTGVIGNDGCCKECGKPHPDYVQIIEGGA